MDKEITKRKMVCVHLSGSERSEKEEESGSVAENSTSLSDSERTQIMEKRSQIILRKRSGIKESLRIDLNGMLKKESATLGLLWEQRKKVRQNQDRKQETLMVELQRTL